MKLLILLVLGCVQRLSFSREKTVEDHNSVHLGVEGVGLPTLLLGEESLQTLLVYLFVYKESAVYRHSQFTYIYTGTPSIDTFSVPVHTRGPSRDVPSVPVYTGVPSLETLSTPVST